MQRNPIIIQQHFRCLVNTTRNTCRSRSNIAVNFTIQHLLITCEIEIAIQVNGKIKAKINIPSSLDEEGIKKASLENEDIVKATEGKTVVKVIVIKGRLVNIVIK